MTEQVWLAQLWAENMLGVLARSRTFYEEMAYLVGRADLAAAMQMLPLCYHQPVKNHVDAYLWVWAYLRPYATADETTTFFHLLHERDPGLNPYLYRFLLRHRLWYLYNSRLFLDDPCPDRLWARVEGAQTLVTLSRAGYELRPWHELSGSILSAANPTTPAERARADLVLLRVGGHHFWNPKLRDLPGSEALLSLFRDSGLSIQEPPAPPGADS